MVTKPVVSRDIVLKDGTHIVVIGDEAWAGQGGGPLAVRADGARRPSSTPRSTRRVLFKGFSGPEWAASAVDKGTEQKNGQNTHHYHIDSTTAANGFSGIPAGASIDTWIADEGYLVSLVATGFGQDLDIEVTNIDDPANKVESRADLTPAGRSMRGPALDAIVVGSGTERPRRGHHPGPGRALGPGLRGGRRPSAAAHGPGS